MDLVEPEQDGSCVDDMSIEEFDSTDAYNVFGEPEIFARVGEQYQVELPPLIDEFDLALYKSNPVEVESSTGVPFNFLIGLPIPLIWINQEVGNINLETTKVHVERHVSSTRNTSFISESVEKTCLCLEKENSNTKTEPSENGQPCMCRGCRLVPGSYDDTWNNNEKDSFLLGLYIFEKNFFQVKRFVESKKMVDILSYYYKKFYGSREYQRWADCRKTKSKRIVYGEQLLTGLRQQELLSRLLPSVSEECQNALSEVSKTFGDGKMSLEDYVFSLKAMVGTPILVDAIGIGKGKKDLTCMAIEPSRANPSRSEIPIGKACAALEPKEIIKFLTGDYRLSKARTSDLFWEAVWPRLLARGWQSEQPKNEGRDSLVFLVPGVKRFSRRKLEKGKDYFHSITDVLTKVASEPEILELTSEVGEENERKEDEELTCETKEKQVDMLTPATRTRHCYLQPRTPSRNTGTMKFTVVDTSLTGGKPYKVRELRSLTLEASNKLVSATRSENSEQFTSEVSSEEPDTVDQGKSDYAISSGMPNGKLPERNDSGPKREIYSTKGRASSSSNIRNSYDDKESKKVIECHSSQRLEKKVDKVTPITKRRRRLTACSNPETSNLTINSSMVPMPELEIPNCCSGDNDVLSSVASSIDKLSSNFSSKGSQNESIERGHYSDSHVAEHLEEGHAQTRTLIDLNVLPVNPDFEESDVMRELKEEQDDRSNTMPEDHIAVKMSVDMATSVPQGDTISRRQSSRNRPPTARSLEALANGFLSVSNRPRKNKDTCVLENITSRTSRRPRTGPGVTDSSSGSMESRSKEGGSSGMCNVGGSNISSEPHALSDGNGRTTNFKPSV